VQHLQEFLDCTATVLELLGWVAVDTAGVDYSEARTCWHPVRYLEPQRRAGRTAAWLRRALAMSVRN